MSDGSTPQRRWFRFAFSLRTLFVVVTILGVLLGWLGWELQFVRARRAWEARLAASYQNNEGGGAAPYPYSQFLDRSDMPGWADERLAAPSVPFWRRWLGDRPFGLVTIPTLWPESEVLRAKALFPEAFVFWRRDFLRQHQKKYMGEKPNVARWIQLVEREIDVPIPAADVEKINTAEDAVRYAEERRGELRGKRN